MPPVELTPQLLRSWALPVDEGGDKHARGTVLIIGGSSVTVGAVLLAGMAALRMGAGRLQIATAPDAAVPLGIAVPEAMVVPLPMHADGIVRPRKAVASIGRLAECADAVLIGSGLMGDQATGEFVAALSEVVSPSAVVVLDAAALENPQAIRGADQPSSWAGRLVLTPNRQEARQLDEASGTAQPSSSEERTLMSLAQAHRAVVTSFGVITSPDGRSWRAPDGGPGLGTSGSGDVLAGLVTGAAARCGDPAQAACWATYVHSLIGQQLSARSGRLGYLARELVDEVPHVMARLDRGTD